MSDDEVFDQDDPAYWKQMVGELELMIEARDAEIAKLKEENRVLRDRVVRS